MSEPKQTPKSSPAEAGSQQAENELNGSIYDSASASIEPRRAADESSWTRRRTYIVGTVAFLAAIAGLTGYTLKDALGGPNSLGFAIGKGEVSVNVDEGEDCAIIFALEATGDEHPRMLGLPITIKNSSNTTAKNVSMTVVCSAPLGIWSEEKSNSSGLKNFAGIKRVTGEVGEISTSSFTIPRIPPGKSVVLIDLILWEEFTWKIDESMPVSITIDAEDRPSRTQVIELWTAIVSGPGSESLIAISKDAQRVDRGLLVHFQNYHLAKARDGSNTVFYTFQAMRDIKCSVLNAEG